MTGKFPASIYDIKIKSCDGLIDDILGEFRGKVTLIFNCAAGCGNIPQHLVLEELNQKYQNEDDFNILAVTVDDFTCHGYEEFKDGIHAYIEKNNLQLTPGQVAKQYAFDNFGATYDFSELVNGRYDKHRYDPSFVPGRVKEQEIHELWFYLTGAHEADIDDNGVPYHVEDIPWADSFHTRPPSGLRGFTPLTGNFEKFLVNRDGTKIKRYPNGFLLGEIDERGERFPWFSKNGKQQDPRDYRPNLQKREGEDDNNGPFPTPRQRKGIDISLNIISRDIDEFLQSR